MKLPTVSEFDFQGRSVAIRIDCDVEVEEGRVVDDTRLDVSLQTINKILEKGASRLFILGHRDRPDGYSENLSTKGLVGYFTEKLNQEVRFVGFEEDFGMYLDKVKGQNERIVMLDNLRFWKGEEENDHDFNYKLAEVAEIYINDAFGSSHRKHASVYGAMKIHLEKGTGCFGMRFVSEVENLEKVLRDPHRPVVFLLSGVKEDKLDYLNKIIDLSDKVLVAGRLPKYLDENYSHPKVIVAKLIMDNEDVTIRSMEQFEQEIKDAGTIVVSGPMGKFEDEGHRQGTKRVLEAVANSQAYKVAGGGDTEHAISMLDLKDKFDWVSIGGGAMLEYLVNGSLPIVRVVEEL